MTPPRRVAIDRHLMAAIWALAIVLYWGFDADPDLWGNLRFGLDVLRDRGVPAADPYSFTSDIPWVNHEWLSEAVMAGAYILGASFGLVLLKIALAGASLILIARRLGEVPLPLRAVMSLLVLWSAAPMFLTLRSQLFSYFFAALLATLLVRDKPGWGLLAIPLIFAVWVNSHGGWLIGGWFFGVWCCERIWQRPFRWWVLGVGAATLGATLLNPYGTEIWRFLATTVGFTRYIREWRPLTEAALFDWIPWGATAAMVVWAALAGGRKALWPVLTVGFLGYAGFRVVRVIPFFVLAAAVYLPPTLARVMPGRLQWHPTAPSRAAAWLALVPAVVVVAMALPTLPERSRCIPIRGDWVVDRPTAAALQQAHPSGTMMTAFGWSHYCIFHFGPGLKVGFDGRRETVYSAELMEQLWPIEAGYPRSLPVLARLRPDFVWLPSRETGAIREWLVENGYRIDVESADAWIAVRDDLPVISPAAWPAPSCFPG